MLKKFLILIPFYFLLITSINAQLKSDSLFNKIDPGKWSLSVEKKLNSLEGKIIANSIKTLHHLKKKEKKIYAKQLLSKDSVAAKANLVEMQTKYQLLENKLRTDSFSSN